MLREYLRKMLGEYDLALVSVLEDLPEQKSTVEFSEVLTENHGLSKAMQQRRINIVRAPRTWGASQLKAGQSAFVFMKAIGSEIYEAPWKGHLIVSDQNGTLIALIPEIYYDPESNKSGKAMETILIDKEEFYTMEISEFTALVFEISKNVFCK
jgi:hypothetical protein